MLSQTISVEEWVIYHVGHPLGFSDCWAIETTEEDALKSYHYASRITIWKCCEYNGVFSGEKCVREDHMCFYGWDGEMRLMELTSRGD